MMPMLEEALYANVVRSMEKAKANFIARIEEAFQSAEEPDEEVQKDFGVGALALLGLLLTLALSGCSETKEKAEDRKSTRLNSSH